VPDLASLTGDPSSLERVYAYSCNVAFAQYALRLGADQLARRRPVRYLPTRRCPESYSGFTDLPTVPSLLYNDPGFLNRPAAGGYRVWAGTAADDAATDGNGRGSDH
jgi:peptidoglycan glycosyltransferase